MKLVLKKIFVIIIFSYASSLAQINSVSIGAGVGLGEIKGNSPSVTSLGASVYLDFVPWFSNDITFRTGFLYAQKLEHFLPESRKLRYYPFVKSYFLKGILRVDLNQLFYLEQGAGLIYLNDRTFGDINEWEPGASFNVLCGIDFSELNRNGILLGLGLDYGITFTKTSASYYLIYLQVQKKL
ncbi:MAG: hypothetical protein GYA14_08560 [Ignavibacteria bacterium]|nr:hypothetical protein [Ignavibacteria bacterium]